MAFQVLKSLFSALLSNILFSYRLFSTFSKSTLNRWIFVCGKSCEEVFTNTLDDVYKQHLNSVAVCSVIDFEIIDVTLVVWEVSKSLTILIFHKDLQSIFQSLYITKYNYTCLTTAQQFNSKSFRCSQKSEKEQQFWNPRIVRQFLVRNQ